MYLQATTNHVTLSCVQDLLVLKPLWQLQYNWSLIGTFDIHRWEQFEHCICYTSFHISLLISHWKSMATSHVLATCRKYNTVVKQKKYEARQVSDDFQMLEAETCSYSCILRDLGAVHQFSQHMMAKAATYGDPRFNDQKRMQWSAIFLKQWSDGWFAASNRVTLDSRLTADSWTWGSHIWQLYQQGCDQCCELTL